MGFFERLPTRILSIFSTVRNYFSSIFGSPNGRNSRNRNNSRNDTENEALLNNYQQATYDNANGSGFSSAAGGNYNQNQLFNRHVSRSTSNDPDDASISRLMSMGFERDAVVSALRANGNNVEAAANSLLR